MRKLAGRSGCTQPLSERRQACNYLKAAQSAAAQIKGGFIGNQALPHLCELRASIKYSSLYFARQSAVRSARRFPGRFSWAFSGPRGGQNYGHFFSDIPRRLYGIKNAQRRAARARQNGLLNWGQDWGQVLKNSLKQAKNRKNLAISLLFRGGAAGTCTPVLRRVNVLSTYLVKPLKSFPQVSRLTG